MTEVGEVWGVGRRLTARLRPLGIQTAWDLAQYDSATLRRQSAWCWRKPRSSCAASPVSSSRRRYRRGR
ncbi:MULTISPECIES: hypothetical protein [Stutzerimonas stutzeri subgroup]|uniref:hypothetical protein n=1 Tax=Stutzerimonas stutzeri subgroup TaxID=578833 RepID=UPI001F2FAEAD|nr:MULTISPECIES: hypothetical protein [Stutzerimonas stutzeri subgroup]